LELINRFGDIIVIIYASSFEMCTILDSKLNITHKHFLVTNGTPEAFGRMVSSCFPCEWNVAILHKSNGRTRKNYQASYLRRQKKLHSKQAKTSRPHKPTMKKTNTILIDEINQWAPYVDIKKSTLKMKKNGNKSWVFNKYMKRKDTQPFSYPMRWVGYSGLQCFLSYMISKLKSV
jgi:hypothetical protein